MILDSFLKEYNINNIVSEQDVRTKVAIPLIYSLGYTQDFIANEFPVYGYEGRTKLNTKFVDIMLFSDKGFENYRNDNQTSWVQNHSLIAIELKKPSEEIKEPYGQAKFYTMWTRAPYYICTNGIEICIYKSENHYADSVLYDGQIVNLDKKWLDIQNEISFNSLSSLKENKNIANTSRPYANYCLSMMSNNDDFIETWWKQKIYKTDKNIEVTLESLKTTQANSIIIAPSGFGKTTCLNLIFQNYLKNYLNNSSEITPIFLSAKFWKRGFCSIVEGIKKELELLVPNITESIIQCAINQNKYAIFIDGLDECFIEKDVLIDEINKISQSSLILVSCRENFYNKELESFDKYNISELCEKDLIEISTEVLDKDTNHVIRQMDNGLKALIKTPLYFHMWLFYCKNNPDSMIPDNITVLIDNFINYMLKEYISAKGNYNFQEWPLSSLKDILAKFAYINFNSEKESIDKIVTESSLKDNAREVIRLFKPIIKNT